MKKMLEKADQLHRSGVSCSTIKVALFSLLFFFVHFSLFFFLVHFVLLLHQKGGLFILLFFFVHFVLLLYHKGGLVGFVLFFLLLCSLLFVLHICSVLFVHFSLASLLKWACWLNLKLLRKVCTSLDSNLVNIFKSTSK